MPSRLYVGVIFNRALAFSRRAHNRFDYTGNSNFCNRRLILSIGCCEAIRRGRNCKLLCYQSANAFAVHCELRGPRTGHDVKAFVFEFDKGLCRNRFDLRHDVIWALYFDHSSKFNLIEHRKSITPIGYLHGRRIRIAIARDNLYA